MSEVEKEKVGPVVEGYESGEGTSPDTSKTEETTKPPPSPLTIHQQLQQILFRFDGKVRLVEPVSGEEWEWDMDREGNGTLAFAILAAQMTGKMLDFLTMPSARGLIDRHALYKVRETTKSSGGDS